jgi:hypothetical protein
LLLEQVVLVLVQEQQDRVMLVVMLEICMKVAVVAVLVDYQASVSVVQVVHGLILMCMLVAVAVEETHGKVEVLLELAEQVVVVMVDIEQEFLVKFLEEMVSLT